MDFLNNLQNNSILLLPYNLRDKVLEYIDSNNLLITLKFMSFNDLKKGLLFDYNNEAINYIMKKNNTNYSVAKNYLKDIYYIDNSNSDKMLFLRNIKDELDKNNLLIFDRLFIPLLKSKNKLYVYGFDYITKFNKHLLDIASEYIDIEIIDKNSNNYKHTVYEFFSMTDEITFVSEQILELLNKGIPMNKIFIANYNEEYYFTVHKIFNFYKIPFFLKNESSLYDTSMASFLLNNLNTSKEILLFNIRKNFGIKQNDNNIVYNKIVNLINSYYWCDNLSDCYELIKEEMKQIMIPSSHYKEEIKVINLMDNVINNDEYVFLIGFNLNSIPKLKRDEDYLSDDIKPSFLETSYEYNNIQRNIYSNILKNIKNITITYKLTSSFNTYYPSFLIDGINLIKEKKDITISKYSNDINRHLLGTSIDNLIKFNEKNEMLSILNNNYKIPYKSYNNKWTGVDNTSLVNHINSKLNFSYSNISTYYQCPFKFYIKNILKVYNYEETFEQFIGNLFHHVLEICLKDDTKDIDYVYDEYIKTTKLELTNSNRFFIKLLKKEIHFVIEAIKEQYKHSSHNEEWTEKRIEINKERKIRTTVKGFVDKLLVLNNKVLVIDYKTGASDKIDPDLFQFGLTLQLPIYLYLLKELDSNIEVAGLYLQHILKLDTKFNPKKDVLEEKLNNLKLTGITINDHELIKVFDDTYEKSNVIKSLRVLKSGEFAKSKNIITKDEREELTLLVETLIDNCIDMVSDGLFDIKPIKILGKYDGCDYCEYKDICYRKYKDFNFQVLNSKGDDNDE